MMSEETTGVDDTSSPFRVDCDHDAGRLTRDRSSGGDRSIRGVGQSALPQDRVRALAFARSFYPGLPLGILARLESSTTVAILDRVDDQVLSRPDEYHGYAIRYSVSTAGVYTFLFTESFLERDGRYRLAGDVNYFSADLTLVAAALEPIDG